MSTLGTEWVDEHVTFHSNYEEVKELLDQAADYKLLTEEEDEVGDEQFYASKTAEVYEDAVSQVVDALERQILKSKEKKH